MNGRVIQIGNIAEEKNFANPQCGRIYSIYGLSPTINTCGGGQREPKIVVEDGRIHNNSREQAKEST